MYDKILERYKNHYVTDAQLEKYQQLGVLSAEEVAKIKNYGATLTLEQAKAQRIQQSKDALETYLASHPLQWTDGNYYSITFDKQQQLSGKMSAAAAAQILGQPYTMEWNDTGMVCRPWDMAEIAALGLAIDARVTALVKYQQTQERAMVAATTLDELNAVVVDYDSV